MKTASQSGSASRSSRGLVININKSVIVCAHRGASSSFPENTIPAFAEAVSLGCVFESAAFEQDHDSSIL
jgi:glycerophosphoryl diester phosphodiesterase